MQTFVTEVAKQMDGLKQNVVEYISVGQEAYELHPSKGIHE